MGGGGTQKSQVTQTTSNLPEYAAPYALDVYNRAQGTFSPDNNYTAYTGERVAARDPMQGQAYNAVGNMQQPGEFGQASNTLNSAAQGSLQGSGYTPTNFSAQQVNPVTGEASLNNYNTNNINSYQQNAPGTFGQAEADKYTSPYMQNVVDVQQQAALRNAKQAQLVQGLGAARSGTYGGARQAIASTERERNLGDLQNQIQAQGSQSAYENAQQQYERDRAAGMSVADANQKASLQAQDLREKQGLEAIRANQDAQNKMTELNTGYNMDAQKANQQYGLEAQRLGDNSKQFAATDRLAGYKQAADIGTQQGALGTARQSSDMERYNAQNLMGKQMQDYMQQFANYDYGDFLEQRDWGKNQLSDYSSIIHGLAPQNDTTASTWQAAPNAAAQLAGAGISAAGLYGMYGKGSQ